MGAQGNRKRTTEELLRAIDACPTIDKLFELVKNEHIVIQMQSFSSASSLPKQAPKLIPDMSPLESLRSRVRQAVLDEARRNAPQPQPRHSREQLIRAIETCPTIDKLFELVKNEHIVIQMRSFSSASSLPAQQLRPEPGASPLDKLRQQVLDAVINGG